MNSNIEEALNQVKENDLVQAIKLTGYFLEKYQMIRESGITFRSQLVRLF